MSQLKLTDVAKINMGQSPSSETYNSEKNGLPFYQGNVDFGEKYPTVRIWCDKPTKIAEPGDILMSVRAPIGALNYANEKCCIGRGLAAITPDPDMTSSEFIYWFLRARHSELNRIGTGSTFKAINRKTLESIEFPKYNKNEQYYIAEILSKIDKTIGEKKAQLEKLDNLIKARFVEMFGDVYKTSKYPKQKWNNIVTIKNGKDYKKVAVNKGGYPVYGTGGEIARTSEFLCPENTIIVGRKGTINNPLLVREKFWNVDTAFGVIPSDKLHYLYFFWFCKMFDFSRLNKQAVLPSTTKADLLNIEMQVPPIELQKQFATFVTQIDKSKFAVQKSLEKTQLLFNSLMQEYFG